MSIIEASCAGFKDMADGTVRFFFDVEPRHAGEALELFRVRGTAAALAALKSNAGRPESDAGRADDIGQRSTPPTLPAPIGPICKWLAMRCKEQEFRAFISNGGGSTKGPELTEEQVARITRGWCGVESRKDIDGDIDAEEKFQRKIRGPWAKYQLARGATNNPTKEHA